MLFDTHAHYDDRRFDGDRRAVIENLKGCGVTRLVNIGCDIKTSRASIGLAEKYDFIYATVGFHPHDAAKLTDERLAEIADLSRHKRVVAIGEIGLDYHYDNSPRDTQRYWFKKQLRLAEQLRMPVVIHNREAHGDMMSILKQTTARGIIHCYSGSAEMARQLVDMGFYISFSGTLTYKNARNLLESAQIVPTDRLLIETDCPYLAPEGYRGRRNDSSLMYLTCEKLAEIKGVTTEEMAKITFDNANNIYFGGKTL